MSPAIPQAEANRFSELDSLYALVRELIALIPDTYGEAVQSGTIEHGECENHEWDNRTRAENAVWLIARRTAERDEALAKLAEEIRLGDEKWGNMMRQRNAAQAELAKYKDAVAAELHYDMQAALSGTPENRMREELRASQAKVAELQAEIADAFKAVPYGGCVSTMVKLPEIIRSLDADRSEAAHALSQCRAALLVVVDMYVEGRTAELQRDEQWKSVVATARIELARGETKRILAAVAREKPDALPLVARLLGAPACEQCGYVKHHCQCNKDQG
jgi:predicted RNase H-like nuclease (RuvC/YqgF family)